MSGDPMKLVKFVCVAKAHADGRSDSALTIHEGAWAFCARGGDGTGHDWRPSDGLPLLEAMRFTPRQQASDPAKSAPTSPKAPAPPAAKGKARTR
ncbi:MAG TPA: hypothetical protein DCK98_15345 [Chloroflexi bacterium]|nr:hypothetical protein [Chloroflexota bacterium]HAL29021.1 hypothetical protein [Chloroflexota bacterium]